MFDNQKFLTRGVENEIPIVADQPYVAHGFDDGSAEKKITCKCLSLRKRQPVSTSSTSRSSRRTDTSLMYRVTML